MNGYPAWNAPANSGFSPPRPQGGVPGPYGSFPPGNPYGPQMGVPFPPPSAGSGMYASSGIAGGSGGNPWLPAGGAPNTEVLSWFQAVDQNGNGKISVSELNQALSTSGNTFSIATTERLLNRFDEDKDGEITLQEFQALHAFIVSMRNAFESRDTDRSGRLSGNEIRIALASRGYGLSEETFQALMRKFDRRKCGSLGFDDYVELSIFLTSVRDTFSFFDKDGSGRVEFNFDTFLLGSVSVVSL